MQKFHNKQLYSCRKREIFSCLQTGHQRNMLVLDQRETQVVIVRSTVFFPTVDWSRTVLAHLKFRISGYILPMMSSPSLTLRNNVTVNKNRASKKHVGSGPKWHCSDQSHPLFSNPTAHILGISWHGLPVIFPVEYQMMQVQRALRWWDVSTSATSLLCSF